MYYDVMVCGVMDNHILKMVSLIAYEFYWAAKTAPNVFIKELGRRCRGIVS